MFADVDPDRYRIVGEYRLLSKILDPPVSVDLPNPVVDLDAGAQGDGADRSTRLVEPYHLGQVHVRQNIAIIHDERPIHVVSGLFQRHSCSEAGRNIVADAHPKLRTIFEVVSENLRVPSDNSIMMFRMPCLDRYSTT